VEALNAERTRSDMLSAVSHEFRTPLNQLLGVSSLLQAQGLRSDAAPCYFEIIRESVERLNFLVDSVLGYASIQLGSEEIKVRPVRVSDAMSRLSAVLAHRLADRKQRLTADLPEDLPHVLADIPTLVKLLALLVDNASRYSGDDAEIVIRSQINGDDLFLEVEDNGPGMDEGELQRALEAFRQVDEGRTRKNDGLGLGLPFARDLVELMNGTLDVYSCVGMGTVVRIQLPISKDK
jgi:signal transduction histidine kinase